MNWYQFGGIRVVITVDESTECHGRTTNIHEKQKLNIFWRRRYIRVEKENAGGKRQKFWGATYNIKPSGDDVYKFDKNDYIKWFCTSMQNEVGSADN